VQRTDPRTLYRRPGDLDVALFVGEAVVLDADIRDGRAHCVLGALSYEETPAGPVADGAARVLLRPEQLRLSAPVPTGPTATVRSLDFYGHDSRAWLELPGGVRVSARLDGADLPSVGDDVSVSVRGTALAFPPVGPGRAGGLGPVPAHLA
jgi:iron(III) transport system ATP-binding protein